MNIGLLDIDSRNFPNLALMKISSYYKNDNVEWATMFGDYDIIYKSKIFDFTTDPMYSYNTNNYICGGTGFDIKSKLPNEIENVKILDYNLYDIDYSLQMFSRGCIRKCPFCVVPEKEGKIKPIEALELNPTGKYIECLDNNFFANPEWEESIKHLIKINQPINFHGVDIRILTGNHIEYLNKLKFHKQLKIAWDSASDKIDLKIKKLTKKIKAYKIMCYVLIGYDSTHEQDIYRVEKLRELKVDPFVMPFDKADNYQKRFARWVNHKAIFKTVDWKNYN